jgi:hypothetical protein
MTHRATRVLLLLLAFVAVGGGGYLLWKLDRGELAVRESAAAFEKTAEYTLLVIERFRAAQQSYVADGQGSEFWMTRVTELLDDLDRMVTAIGRGAASSEFRDSAAALATTVSDMRKMDARAREWVRTGQSLMASDLIFTESLTTSSVVIAGVTTLRDRHQQLTATALADVRRRQIYVLGGAGAVCLIVALLLVPAVRQATPRDTREALRALIERTPATTRPDTAVRLQSATVVPATAPPSATQPATAATAPSVDAPVPALTQPAVQDASAPADPVLAVDIPGAARLCSELARVLDPADLPALLERSAALLNASGLIVWVGDRSGSALFPMFAHGYSSAALSRMRGIHRDDENATATCYRLAEDRIVPARSGDPGAIVTPIVTPEGCIGVLAAEVSEGIEGDADRRALAAILAAQLSTLVTTLPAPNEALQAQG